MALDLQNLGEDELALHVGGTVAFSGMAVARTAGIMV